MTKQRHTQCVSHIVWSSSILVRKYTGILTYRTDYIGRIGRTANVELNASFSPGGFTVIVEDGNAQSAHTLTDRRFNYQARDSPQDLLAREMWRSLWFGRFAGPMCLQRPRIPDAPRELRVNVFCSWGAAFAVTEFRAGDTFYQFPRRPPRGANTWTRLRYPMNHAPDDAEDTEHDTNRASSSDLRNPPAGDPPI